MQVIIELVNLNVIHIRNYHYATDDENYTLKRYI